MIRKHELDLETSLKIYEEQADVIEIKLCYHNVFNMLSRYPEKFRTGEWKVAYGCIYATDEVYVRHCFIVTKEGKVIDPTIGTWDERKYEEQDYTSFILLDAETYLNLILKNDCQPILDKVLREDEKRMHRWARKRNIVVVG